MHVYDYNDDDNVNDNVCHMDGVNLKDKEEGDDDYDNDDNDDNVDNDDYDNDDDDDDDDDMCQQGWGMSLVTTRLVGDVLGTAGGDNHD